MLEQIRQQLDDLTRSIDARLQTATEEAHKDGGTKKDTVISPQATTIDWGKIVRLYEPEKAQYGQTAENQEEASFEFLETPKPESYRENNSPLDELNKLSQAKLSAKAKSIRDSSTALVVAVLLPVTLTVMPENVTTWLLVPDADCSM